ncbi:MAG: 5-(carboxyamino)imidazole ribonucleotide synthase [Candidatus Eremiobacteraeota bacterium]|nr:5-(carboxyamino)imidazole ribonucleotide synthase [Candidatus Eremiobacteraeota bacterium]
METIGVIGGGQLGRMFALDAKRMGYNVITLDPQPHSPCGQVADEQIIAAYDDMDAIDQLGRRSDVVTYEFENIAIESVRYLEEHGYAVTPSSHVLAVTQDRLLEKQFVADCGIGVAPFAAVRSDADVAEAASRIGFPAVLKTARGGYDGKGQWRVNRIEELRNAVGEAKGAALILEAFVPFVCEISVICTRNAADQVVTYPVAENLHDNGILSRSIAPARVSETSATAARSIATTIARELDIVGTFCVEFFVTADDGVLVNEIAPRPHNSGHYSIDATPCSQYEQHVRAICALPLSEPALLRNAIMMNILGTGTGDHLAGLNELLTDPSIVLHLYGKHHAVNRRKMGHFTMLVNGPVDDAALERARRAHDLLRWTQ